MPPAELRAALVEVAQDPKLRELVRAWDPDTELDRLVADVDQDPVAAALWDVLWRFEPDLNARLGAVPSASPNPFLAEQERLSAPELAEWPLIVADRDHEAARILAAAIRVERDQAWSNADRMADRYAFTLDMVDQPAPEAGRRDAHPGVTRPDTPPPDAESGAGASDGARVQTLERPSAPEGRAWGLAVSVASDPAAQLEHMQEVITRLLLLGHPDTTLRVLREHAEQVITMLRRVDPSDQAQLLLDCFVAPVNLAVDRFVGGPPLGHLLRLLGLLGSVRSAATAPSAHAVVGALRRRLLATVTLEYLGRFRRRGHRTRQVRPR